jgi:3',5'-cyclic AMP phosphodiesterase CpdA
MRRSITAAVLLIAAILVVSRGAESKNDFRFAIIGDRTGTAMPGIYERVLNEVGLNNPDFAINVGDTIEGVKDELAESQWREVRPIWSRYRFPFYFTPGNHDIWSERSLQIYKKETGRPNFYSFNYQDAHFTVLDNSRTLELDDDQLKFLEEDLKANRERSPKFVFFHKPYWIAFLMLGSGEFPLHQLATKYGVGYIVSGHGHQFMRMTRDGITYMAVGSSGAKLKGEGFAQGWFYHHVQGVVKGSKVELTVKELDGPTTKGRVFRAEEWDRSGPKFAIKP